MDYKNEFEAHVNEMVFVDSDQADSEAHWSAKWSKSICSHQSILTTPKKLIFLSNIFLLTIFFSDHTKKAHISEQYLSAHNVSLENGI